MMFRFILISLPLLVILAGMGVTWHMHQGLTYRAHLETPVNIVIKPGESFKSIAKQLSREGVLGDPAVVSLYARLNGHASRIKAGEYEFSGELGLLDVIRILETGRVKQHQLALIEGKTFQDWLDVIRAHPKIKQTLAGLSDTQIMSQLGRPNQKPEGFFFPDTYTFTANDTDVMILKHALKKMTEVLDQEWARRMPDLPYKTSYEALIMASIIEKETGIAQERSRIAGVFVTRLSQGMRLQTDPTVIYGLRERFRGNLKRVHLKENTPYNTYVHKGLPPTPIAMPSLAAIQAALHPRLQGELYFVSKGDGSHYFSKTLEEHNLAVRKYQLKLQ